MEKRIEKTREIARRMLQDCRQDLAGRIFFKRYLDVKTIPVGCFVSEGEKVTLKRKLKLLPEELPYAEEAFKSLQKSGLREYGDTFKDTVRAISLHDGILEYEFRREKRDFFDNEHLEEMVDELASFIIYGSRE